MKKALIFYGGWDGHEPESVSAYFQRLLEKNGYEVDRFEGTDCLSDGERLLKYDLIVPHVTMSEISAEHERSLAHAVSRGVGLAGCHGGMCDAFRNSTLWQFVTGGQWVAHPGSDKERYTVHINHGSSPITEGISDFEVETEHYYMHVDPAIEVLATTRFPLVNYYHAANKAVDMPVAWTKFWGLGRVFYCSLGHNSRVFENPSAELLMERGLIWAGGGKEYAEEQGLDATVYEK